MTNDEVLKDAQVVVADSNEEWGSARLTNRSSGGGFSDQIKRRDLLAAAGVSVIGAGLTSTVSAAPDDGDEGASGTGVAIVVLDLDPLAGIEERREEHAERLAEQRQEYVDWLDQEAPDTEVLYEYELVLNGLAVRRNGHGLDTLRGGPNVRYVTASKPIYPTMGESVKLIGADEAWIEFDNPDMAGKDVKVAILDTGISFEGGDPDDVHPFFRDDDFPSPVEGWPRGNGDDWEFDEAGFTNNKVIAAYAYWDDPDDVDEDAGEVDPGDWHGHGTHVGGTAGGRAATQTDLEEDVSGVAPGPLQALMGGTDLSTAQKYIRISGTATAEALRHAHRR